MSDEKKPSLIEATAKMILQQRLNTSWKPGQPKTKKKHMVVSHTYPGCGKHGTVTLSSFGLETFDHQLRKRCQQMGGGAHCSVPQSEVATALRRQVVNSNLIVDARNFPDPDRRALCQLNRSGRHYKLVENLIRHHNSWDWLRNVKAKFQQELEKTAGDTSVHIYCKTRQTSELNCDSRAVPQSSTLWHSCA